MSIAKDGEMVRLQHIFVIAVVIGSGCATPPKPEQASAYTKSRIERQMQRLPTLGPEIQLASHTENTANLVPQPVVRAVQEAPAVDKLLPELLPPGTTDELAPAGVLDVNRMVTEVVARNPSFQAMVAAWQAAASRYPQVIALDDPMFNVSVGPGSWGNSDVESAYMVMASQKFSWPGKRQLRGTVAGSEADGAASQIEDMQLRLAEMARLAFYDYFAAYHQLALNGDNVKETREFRETAEAKLRASLVTQQDVLQADVELALLERRRNELERRVKVAAARINTLLHLDAVHPLPPPPEELNVADTSPPPDELRYAAIQRRPDLAALAAQIQADEATLALAWKEFYPDVELYAKYDAFWQEHALRSAVGVNVNVPLNKSRRCAAVREAEAKLRQHRAEYDRLEDEVSNEIHASYEHLLEARRTSLLYRDRIVPAAKQNVESARAGYTAGKVDFLRLIEAQRQLINLREEQVETMSNYHRRLAELDRAAAVPVELAR
jgi:cobalt-zinc-cadmium efflux system outer membrane protein